VAADTTTRWVGSGHSRLAEARTAGATAAHEAVTGTDAKLVVVYASSDYDLVELLAGVRDITGTVPLIGCSTDGEFGAGEISTDGVTVAVLGGPGFTVSATVAHDASPRRREAGQQVAATVADVQAPHRVLMLLCDGLTRDQQDIVRGAYSVVGAEVQLVGGCAADLNKYERTYQFYGDKHGVQILSDAVVGAAIGSVAPIGVGIAHGWRKTGDAAVVTGSDGGELIELDGKPALEWYLEQLGTSPDILADPQAFHALAFNHPLGMSRRTGEDIRVIHSGDPDKGSLLSLADIPQGAVVWIMEASEEDLIEAVGLAHTDAMSALSGAPTCGLFAFDCGARYALLGAEGAEREVAVLDKLADGVPVAGFYTYGEIARTKGARGMHHLTLVLMAFA
jgi:hypothetical protein